ncbi:MAG: carboxypeptidase-like regulatory domain-containing protein [Bacteroidota bacterium]
MKKSFIFSLFALFCAALVSAQETNVTGQIIEDATEEPIPSLSVQIESTGQTVKTDANGTFSFEGMDLPEGEQVLRIEESGYQTKRFPIILQEGETLEMGVLYVKEDLAEEDFKMGTISIADNELDEGDDVSFNISGLLQASRDVFLRAASFDFSSTFFRPRGLDNANGKVLINGMEMNKQFSGRPQWANWGGLNDVSNNREFSMYSKANDYAFGDVAGTTNLIMRASKLRKGGRVSYASSDRSYEGRLMASYNSGMLDGGWAYSVMASRRYGEEGFREGTPYDANSFFISVEKRLNDNHSLNFTSFYAPNNRGIGTSITEEAKDLKGIQYNPNWGYQNGDVRNARMRRTEEPVFMLNHYWDINDKVSINTNAMYQTGRYGTTRVDNGGTRMVEFNGEQTYLGGATNPSPIYYQNLPSYHLRFANPSAASYQQAWFAREEFENDGQFDWESMYSANINNQANGGNSTYILQEDRVDDTQMQFNSIIQADLADNILFNGTVNYRNLKSKNFAEVADLLGGDQFLDIDFFADENPSVVGALQDLAQSDTRNPNRLVTEGDKYKYNYQIDAEVYDAFAQTQFFFNEIDFYIGANAGRTTYQREGFYENGFFPGNESYGKGEKLDFFTYGIKAGATYKITGRHLLELNASRMQNAPTIRNSYSNARQNNEIVDGLEEIVVNSADLSYIFRSPSVKARATAFYSTFQNETNVGFYFAENLTGLDFNDGSSFIQEVMSGIDRQHLGAEFGIEYQVTPTINLKAAGSWGQYTYTSNPDLYLTGRDFPGEKLTFGDGKSSMKDLHVPGGPQQAYQLGFEYRDPDYWNIGITANYFADNYVRPSGLLRSEHFTLDNDALPFPEYDETEARQLLKQERFSDYLLFNLVGGKSWRISTPKRSYYIGFFAVINNLFDTEYTTGGFEQSRLADYRSRQEDMSRPNGPLFGNRYYYGFGRTYYLNAYIRF